MKSALITKTLDAHNLRCTKQRAIIYGALLESEDHPSAEELYHKVKSQLPSISLATVYNTLETLVSKKVINKVNTEQGCVHYCPSAKVHAHFYCNQSAAIYDVEIDDFILLKIKSSVPPGFEVEHMDITLSGVKKF